MLLKSKRRATILKRKRRMRAVWSWQGMKYNICKLFLGKIKNDLSGRKKTFSTLITGVMSRSGNARSITLKSEAREQ